MLEGNGEEQYNTWGVFCHLAALVMFLGIPLGNILGPLVVWLIKKEESSFVAEQGREAMNFQISMTIYGLALMLISMFGVLGILSPVNFLFFGVFSLVFIVAVLDLVLVIIAAVKTGNGEYYKYPLTIRFIK